MLKVSGLPGGLKRHMEIAGALDKVKLQASVPVITKDGKALVQEAEIYAILCKKVSGTRLSGREMFLNGDVAAAYSFGKLIGKLHLALAEIVSKHCSWLR